MRFSAVFTFGRAAYTTLDPEDPRRDWFEDDLYLLGMHNRRTE